ncbi:MAG: Maf family protein [Desulfobacterales bacterium]|jgi:septum formation protein|nr:Maf family protein [Desulfobacterales bacterium]
MKVPEVNPKIILASQSPRRRYLLERAGLKFSVIPSTVDEAALPADDPALLVRALAEAKAADVAGRFPQSWVIAADTIVLVEGRVLGKPGSENEARAMLARLSGRTHQVLTGYCLCCRGLDRRVSEVVSTDVLFKLLTPIEIDWYIRTGEPFDKAGAYAIQGIGTFLVKRINGSYTNVVGLPVCEVIEHLIREGVVGWDPAAANALEAKTP